MMVYDAASLTAANGDGQQNHDAVQRKGGDLQDQPLPTNRTQSPASSGKALGCSLTPMARTFLYFVALLIAAVIATAVAWRLNPGWFMRTAFVPRTEFVAPPPPAENIYADPAMWLARPDMTGDNPSLWMPRSGDSTPGVRNADADPSRLPVEGERGGAAIFFVHPTSYLSNDHWNAPLEDEEANWRADLFVRSQSSVFAVAGDVWAPRYRQATMGAFLTRDVVTANRALDAAYADVEAAFDQFLDEIGPNRPIILAGHSQGSLHLARLMRQRVQDNPLARRIIAAYIVGWPISVERDLPRMGLPACETAESSNCILAWQSFAEPADPEMILEVFDSTIGFDRESRRGSRMLCINPITGVRDGIAERADNSGTLYPDKSLADATLGPPATGARCDDAENGGRGLLLIGAGPDLGGYLLPGNNYHVYDYALFWPSIQADVLRRTRNFATR